MTPHHQIKEVVQELLRNVVGGSMLTPAGEERFFLFLGVKILVSAQQNILGFLQWLSLKLGSVLSNTHLFWWIAKRLNQASWSSLGRSMVTWLLTNILYKRSSGIEPGEKQ